ncbi:MAG: xylulokinase, partial [Arthrobacter sp.]|nr:xylulokinase [Arthrobacter sp.]
MSVVVGVDSSTQSCKVLAVDAESGDVISSGAVAHPDLTAVDPQVWTSALREAWQSAGADRLGGSVAAAGIAAQQHGMVALDSSSMPVHDALLWNDTRSAADAARLRDDLGPEAWVDAVNLVPVASFTISKLAWLARNKPDAAGRVDQVVLPHDWLNGALSGEFTTDRSDASGTGYFSPLTDS